MNRNSKNEQKQKSPLGDLGVTPVEALRYELSKL